MNLSRQNSVTAPRTRSKPVFRTLDWFLYIALSAFQAIVVILVLSEWLDSALFSGNPLAYVILSVVLVMFIAVHLSAWVMIPRMRNPERMEAAPGLRVGAVTTFVPGAESLEMLERTLRAMVAMDYPHETWLLDEGDDPEVKALCRRLNVSHWSRRNKPHYHSGPGTRFQARSKHGNYNAFFDETGYERFDIISGFDPDHVPRREFLLRTLGYFRDPEVGFVQAPQIYYNQEASFIAKGAAEETYGYYACTQRSAYAGGWPLVTGCHHTHRVTALREVGGFAAHDADDMLITFHYRQANWRGVYVPEVLAEGLTPADWASYLKQQRRWARSVLDLKLRVQPFSSFNLPLVERVLSLVHGIGYVQGLVTLLGYVALLSVLVTGNSPFSANTEIFRQLLLLSITVVGANYLQQRYFLRPGRERGLHWRAAFLQWVKWPVLAIALAEAVLGRKVAYALTPKGAGSGNRSQFRDAFAFLWPHAATAVLTMGALAVSTLRFGPPDIVLLGWSLLFIGLSCAAIASSFAPAAPAYDPKLAPEETPGSPTNSAPEPAFSWQTSA